MAISFERFRSWCENHFDIVKVKNNEIKVNSPFYEELHGVKDYKCKLWCNPTGGKKGLENGVFRCWRTDKKGSLISLVMLVEKCSYEDALAILGVEDTSMAEIESQLEKLLETKQEESKQKTTDLQLPPYSFLLEELHPSNFHRVTTEVYLFNRSLPIDGLYICIAGDYKYRIIIPYYNKEGKLIYFNGRYIGHNKRIEEERKYMGPEGHSVLKGDVIYMPTWPEKGTKVYYTEGEFDAKSIVKAGLFAGAFGGKAMSESQIELIRPYRPIICLDNDQAGLDALPIVGDALLSKGIAPVGYVLPPKQCKDWNKLLEKYGPRILAAYLENNEHIYDAEYSLRRKINVS